MTQTAPTSPRKPSVRLVHPESNLAAYDDAIRAAYGPVVIGVDECGRGALAGPLTACAVALKTGTVLPGLDDSKKMTEARRKEAATSVREQALAFAVVHVAPAEIDEKGLTWANQYAMNLAARFVALSLATSTPPESVFYVIDQAPKFLYHPHRMLPKADGTSQAVAAASVVGKTERDALMEGFAALYPGYGWEDNKGYINPAHKAGINAQGLLEGLHRFSYNVAGIDRRLAEAQPAWENLSAETASLILANADLCRKLWGARADSFLSDLNVQYPQKETPKRLS